jgi:ADP-heptose:LPS heptosyltransferase
MNFRIKNPHGVHPPGGWQYQEEGWTAPSPLANDCRTQTVNISNFRKQNPRLGLSTHLADCEQALFNYTAARLKFHVNWCEGMDDDSKKNSTTPNQPPLSAPVPRAQGVVSRFWDRLKQDVSGLATLARWMGGGGDPVEPAVAATRAQACLKCPHNQPGNAVEAKIAAEILEQTSLRKKLNLVVPGEPGLKSCNLCGCHLPLKVWVPNIAALEGRPPWCWQKGEVTRPTGRPKINIHRGGAFGDVIQSSTLADSIDEAGYEVHFLAGEVERVCLQGHPSIASMEPAPNAPTIELDWAYERSPDFTSVSIQSLLQCKNDYGLRHQRVPQLALTDEEKQEAHNALAGLPRPIIGIAAASGSWKNRQTHPDDWRKVAETMPEATFISLGPWPLPRPVRNLNVNGFRRVMALINECDAFVGVDTGLLHVAAAFRKPMGVIEGPFRSELRVTDGSDYLAVKAPVDCLYCSTYTCQKHDPAAPPCQRLDVEMMAKVMRQKVFPKGMSVLIPTMKGWNRIPKVIFSLQGESEVLLGLDGDAVSASFQHCSAISIPNPTGKRNGFGKTCNRMARYSSGEFLFFLNDDCYMDPNAVEAMLRHFDDPSVGVVGCKTRYPDGRLYFAGSYRPVGATNFGHIQDHRFTQPTEMEFINFAAAIVRRKAFYAVGGFDERYDCYSEDADLCLRLRLDGWKLIYEPHATGIHDESQTTSPMKMKLLQEGEALFSKRWKNYLLSTPPMR